MKSPSWQMVSIISRFIAVFIGLVQSIIIVKLLTVGDYGLIKLVTSIVAVVGVYQNLGLSSGSTREISASRDRKEAFKVFLGSLFVRYAISLPLVVILFFGADYIGRTYYNRLDVVFPLQIFAIILLIQSLQSVLNSVIQGLKKFKFLFHFQAWIAVFSLSVFVPFLYYFGYLGFFYANLVFNLVSTTILLIYAMSLFKDQIAYPSKKELLGIFKAVFSIGLFVYAIKIVFTQWQNIGPLILAKEYNDEVVGIFGFAILVASKITTISDAVTDVSLPVNTEIYENEKLSFKSQFVSSNSKAYLLILFVCVFLVLFKVELFQIVDILFAFINKESITERYFDAFRIMDPLIFAFWGYSHLNLLKSGLAIPSRHLKEVLIAFIVMFISTVMALYVLPFDALLKMALAMFIGGILGYLTLLLLVKFNLGFFPLAKMDIIYSGVVLLLLTMYYAGVNNLVLGAVLIIATVLVYNNVSGQNFIKKYHVK